MLSWWNRLNFKIPLFVGLLTLGPLVVFGVGSIWETRKDLRALVAEDTQNVLEHAAGIAQSSIWNSIEKLKIILNTFEGDLNDQEDQEYLLQMLQKEDPEARSLSIVNMNGMETAKVDTARVFAQAQLKDRSKTQAFVTASNDQLYIGKVRMTTAGTRRLRVAVPIVDPVERRVLSVLIADLSILKLIKRVVKMKVGESGIIFILDADGKIIAHPDFSKVLAGESMAQHEHFQHFLDEDFEKLHAVHTVAGPDGFPVIVSGLESPELKWIFMAQQPAAEAFSLVDEMREGLSILLGVLALLTIGVIFYFVFRFIRPLRRLQSAAVHIGDGDLEQSVQISTKDEMGSVAEAFNAMAGNLLSSSKEQKRQEWLKTGISGLDDAMRSEQQLNLLCREVITYTAKYLNARIGAIFIGGEDGVYRLRASYAFKTRKGLGNEFNAGEGLVGQAALERESIIFTEFPDDYVTVSSGLGEKPPRNILVVPLVLNDVALGVLEIGAFEPFSEDHRKFLEDAAGRIAIAVNLANSREQLRKTLEKTQSQAEELKAQEEELRTANEELEEKTEELQASQTHLESQEEELRTSNEELEEKAQALEERQEMIDRKNQELLEAKSVLEEKAQELELTGKYKSEFLANMSHELRTPLNSLILLAQDLSRNKEDNLTEDQLEAVDIIRKGGEDLLQLISDILDLSKIEAGHMTVHTETVRLREVTENLVTVFKPACEEKNLTLSEHIEEGMVDVVQTDRQKLEQILRNLLSNALKFTENGGITINIESVARRAPKGGSVTDPAVAISVMDTGIGIPQEKQALVFESFAQGDGSTSRQYGGTGLGLSISRELARLLGGELMVESEVGKGATFTLFLPERMKGRPDDRVPGSTLKAKGPRTTVDPQPLAVSSSTACVPSQPSIPDDRDVITPDDRIVLVVEDDENFARVLRKTCHEHHFKCIHSADGGSALALVREYMPSAVILDIHLPGMDGWRVLDALKGDPKTRHIPVHMMSVDEETIEAYRKGAIGFLTKPVKRPQLDGAFKRIEDLIKKKVKKLLVVEDDPVIQKDVLRLIGNGDVSTLAVDTGEAAIREMSKRSYDCVIMDLKLPDISGFEVLQRLDAADAITIPPIVIYTGKDLTPEEEFELQRYAASIIVKGVRSRERLLDETSLFLHRVVDALPPEKQRMIARIYDGDTVFLGKQVLVADDDMRNLYAISRILEGRGMTVHKAANGKKALEVLDAHPEIDLVLMDIMMPEMDGYEAIGRIRKQTRFKKLPILAVTAKAMKEDRSKCIDAGADDYMSKPVDMDQLLSLMRVWLTR